MKIEQRFQKLYSFTCHNCHTKLLLDDNDFTTKVLDGTNIKVDYISTPCPVCGKLWDNVSKNYCPSKYIPID